MGTVRCKFTCVEVAKRKGWGDHKAVWAAKFNAVMDGSDDNKRFFAATPSGHLEVSTLREDHFEVGQDYYLDITPAPAQEG